MSFKSWQSFWEFEKKIIHGNRYIHDGETAQFLSEVLRSSKSRHKVLKQGHMLWRSQLGSDLRIITDEKGEELDEEPCPLPENRMFPLKYMANEGRVNPKGIPYLYLATTKETAMCEVRPWVGTEISVAQFKIIQDLTIIDCSLNHSMNPFYFDVDNKRFYEPEEKEREKAVWAHIDKAFSAPIVPNENQAHYVPTQVIAELFKSNGFGGVAYKSMLGEGYNIALFDLQSADLLNCFLYEPKSVSFEFQQTANPYFIKNRENT